jgi:hypothetical protein
VDVDLGRGVDVGRRSDADDRVDVDLAVVSTLVGAAMPTMVSMSILAVVGDGAGESIDPDPVVPTVGAN